MTIAIFATEARTLQEVVSGLTEEGLDVRARELGSPGRTEPLGPEIGKGVLVFPKHGAAEATVQASRLLTGERRLILCAPQPDSEGRELLKGIGAAEVVTPRSWEPAHVVERVLAQLILEGDVTPSFCGSIRGATRVMRDLYRKIELVARYTYPVLVVGETGTGKELVPREIHRLGKRHDHPYRALNCGTMRLDLINSELFGHEKGAFTSAVNKRRGMMLEVGHGTLCLDEIGELDPSLQSSLLRVLEERKAKPVGSDVFEEVHARFVFATNRDLEAACEDGRFRHDLYARISGLTLEMPPLRERRADLPLLFHHFLNKFNRENEVNLRVPEGALDCLFEYEWPHNVRELGHAVERAAVYGDDEYISALQLLRDTRDRNRKRTGKAEAGHYVTFDLATDTRKGFLARAEVAYLKAVLAAAGGNKKEAAGRAGMSVSQFYKKLEDAS